LSPNVVVVDPDYSLTKLTILTKLTNEPSQPSRIKYRASIIQNPVSRIEHRESSNLRAYKPPLQLSRILYKSPLFMQNKPNFQDTQMNVSIYLQKAYENKRDWTLGENKPNSNPIKPNCRKGKIDAKCVFTKDYRKNDDFLVRINKPNLRNGQNERKYLYHKGL